MIKTSFFRSALVRMSAPALGLIALFSSLAVAGAAPTRTTASQDGAVFGREPWPAQRVVIIMPIQLGPGWNLNREQALPILPTAEQKFQQALQRTGKFSTTQLHRYNPIFLRGIQDKILTREQVDAIVAKPTLEEVQRALSLMRFEQPPLIADIALDEVTVEASPTAPALRSQVTGRLFEANNPVAIRTISVTSDPTPLYVARKKGKETVMVRRSTEDRIIAAADNAFNQVARGFVQPIASLELPEPVAPVPVPATAPPITGTTRPVIVVPQGQVLGTFPVQRRTTTPAP